MKETAANCIAYLEWRMSVHDRAPNYVVMAEGYFLAVIRLIESLMQEDGRHDADAVIYPMLFNLHQGIELYLKGTSIALDQIKQEGSQWEVDIKKTHDLELLIDCLNEHVTAIGCKDLLERNESTAPLYDAVDLCKWVGDDRRGSYYVDFARYPEQLRKSKPTVIEHAFVLADDCMTVNLNGLLTIVRECFDFLDGYYSQFADQLERLKARAQTC